MSVSYDVYLDWSTRVMNRCLRVSCELIVDGMVVMDTYLKVSCDECLDWRNGVMNCRKKRWTDFKYLCSTSDGGEVSTVVGISYVQLANNFEVQPIRQSNLIPQLDLPYC